MNKLDVSKYEGHTPGPWEIAQYTNHEGYSIWARGHGCIAERWHPTKLKECEERGLRATAHLIKDAPAIKDYAIKLEARVAELERQLEAIESEIESAYKRVMEG